MHGSQSHRSVSDLGQTEDLSKAARRDAELNEKVQRAEANFVRRFKGRSASIEFDESLSLMFWRLGKRWGLYVVAEDGVLRPLVNASRDVRQAAGRIIADLEIQLEVEE